MFLYIIMCFSLSLSVCVCVCVCVNRRLKYKLQLKILDAPLVRLRTYGMANFFLHDILVTISHEAKEQYQQMQCGISDLCIELIADAIAEKLYIPFDVNGISWRRYV